MNSEERINRIMGFHRPAAGKGEPRDGCGGAVWGLRGCGDASASPVVTAANDPLVSRRAWFPGGTGLAASPVPQCRLRS